jgi:hypothetical protein
MKITAKVAHPTQDVFHLLQQRGRENANKDVITIQSSGKSQQ